MQPSAPTDSGRAQLSLWDTISIIVGIIIGAGIYETAPGVFNNTDGPIEALAIWVLGGALCLLGAFCFAELASSYPRSGGEYVYLTRAFGSWMGFLFAWAQLAVIRTGGSIAMLAYIFAGYFGKLLGHDFSTQLKVQTACGVIAALTVINILGVSLGKWTQNVLTGIKVVSLAGILVVGIALAPAPTPDQLLVGQAGEVVAAGDGLVLLRSEQNVPLHFKVDSKCSITLDGESKNANGEPVTLADLSKGMRVKAISKASDPNTAIRLRGETRTSLDLLVLALIVVLWTYAGWHEGAYVAAEVRNQHRNLPLALLLGTGAVILLYVLVNVAYLAGLGYEGAAASTTVAADLFNRLWEPQGAALISLLVVLSTLGGINGMVFTSSRILAEFGRDHRLFAAVGRWHPQLGTPVLALLVQGVFSIGFVLAVAWLFDGVNAFYALLKCTAGVFWLFFFLVGVALIVLRFKDRGIARPFSTPAYPLMPLAFCAFTAFMAVGCFKAAPGESLIGLGVALVGLPLYFMTRERVV